MELNSEVVSRRLNQIACHIHPRPASDVIAPASLTATACSAGKEFHQAYRKDSRTIYGRQGNSTQPHYMQQSQLLISKEEHGTENHHHSETVSGTSHFMGKAEESPLFSKPVPNLYAYNDGEPLFARATKSSNGESREGDLVKESQMLKSVGLQWTPHMDTVESKNVYAVIVELPGVNAETICVEVDKTKLVVMGMRSADWWLDHHKLDTGPFYHRKELQQGPYRVVWQIPHDGDIDSVRAEFIDGCLGVIVPKSHQST